MYFVYIKLVSCVRPQSSVLESMSISPKVEAIASTHTHTRVHLLRRYAWRESPCRRLEACAIYSVENQLPAPPFIYNGLIQWQCRMSSGWLYCTLCGHCTLHNRQRRAYSKRDRGRLTERLRPTAMYSWTSIGHEHYEQTAQLQLHHIREGFAQNTPGSAVSRKQQVRAESRAWRRRRWRTNRQASGLGPLMRRIPRC